MSVSNKLLYASACQVAFHIVALVTVLLEVPLFLAFDSSQQTDNSSDDPSLSWSWPWPCDATVPPLALVSYWGGDSGGGSSSSSSGGGGGSDGDEKSWLGWALAAHLLALAGYPILVIIPVGMWSEVNPFFIRDFSETTETCHTCIFFS